MQLVGAVRLSGGHDLAVRLLVRREWSWADGGATGCEHGLGLVGHGVRLRKVETMHPGRRDTVGEIVWISSLEFLRPPLC